MAVATVTPSVRSRKEENLFALAASLGFCCQPTAMWAKELAHSLVTRMRARLGTEVYQTIAYSIPGFPLAVARSLLSAPTTETPTTVTWEATTPHALLSTLGEILTQSTHLTAGLTRALKTPSEAVIRVVATLMPLAEISHVKAGSAGLPRLYINLMYVLTDEAGEMHYPKDGRRREMAVSPAMEAELRTMVLANVRSMWEKGYSLSAGWLRQLGIAAETVMVAVSLEANEAAQSHVPGQRRSRRRREEFEVEAILEQRGTQYKVLWAGYASSWEAYRIEGEIGTPLVTWEPRTNVKNSEAYQAWQARAQ
jgi:hypothetical protein